MDNSMKEPLDFGSYEKRLEHQARYLDQLAHVARINPQNVYIWIDQTGAINQFDYREVRLLRRLGLLARNIKQAIVGSARFLQGLPMTILRGSVFIAGDKDGFIPVTYKSKTMRQDMVTVGMGSADIRFRGQVDDWEMEFLIKFDQDI